MLIGARSGWDQATGDWEKGMGRNHANSQPPVESTLFAAPTRERSAWTWGSLPAP